MKFINLWSLVCGASSVDQRSNNISAFNILEEIQLTLAEEDAKKYHDAMSKGLAFSVAMPHQFISLFESRDTSKKERSNRSPSCDLVLILPDGTEHSLTKVSFDENSVRQRFVVSIAYISIKTTGTYRYRLVQTMGKEAHIIAEVPLKVTITVKD